MNQKSKGDRHRRRSDDAADDGTRTLAYAPFWEHLYGVTPRPLAFRSSSREEWEQWRAALRGKLRELLGPERPATPPRLEVLRTTEHRGYFRDHIVFDSEPYASVTAYVLRPKGSPPARGWPGLLCLHGHAIQGKDVVAGEAPWTLRGLRLRRATWLGNKNFAEAFVRRGYVCLVPDARGWGERADGFHRRSKDDRRSPFGGHRDPCNVHFLNAQLYGINLIGLVASDDRRALDILAARNDVDADRLGAVGFSFGGTRTLLLAALDDRIRAADVSCYLSSFQEYGVRLANTCGSQLVPGVLQWCEMEDIAALVAPRALLCESGTRDDGFPLDAAIKAFATVRRAYETAGVPERCVHEIFEGGHMFAAGRTFAFFDRWLRNAG